MKKLAIVGASHFVARMFEACGNYQWAREFLKNSLEAGATKVEFGIEWQAVEKKGVYRRVISDNGSGMTRDEVLRFFSTLGEGAKRIGGIHDNFGVGAKIASLPWNPQGVVVVSYKDGQPSMIQIELDPDSAEYELIEFETETGNTYVINPADIDWGVSPIATLAEGGSCFSRGIPITITISPKNVVGHRFVRGRSGGHRRAREACFGSRGYKAAGCRRRDRRRASPAKFLPGRQEGRAPGSGVRA